MDKFQSIRVEWLAADIAVVRIIEKITGKGMTDIAHMDPDLMSPAGIQLQTDIRKILFFIIGKKMVMGSGCLTIFKVNTVSVNFSYSIFHIIFSTPPPRKIQHFYQKKETTTPRLPVCDGFLLYYSVHFLNSSSVHFT